MTSNNDHGCECPSEYHEYGVHAPGHRPVGVKMPVPLGAYPVEDFASMSPSAAALLLRRAVVEAEAETEARQHIVIARDIETGAVTYSHPFPTGLEALAVAQQLTEQNRTTDPKRQFTLTVVPLLPRCPG